MKQQLPQHYRILGVTPGASAVAIREAYLLLARTHHPDTGQGDADKFKSVTEAYTVLKNPVLRDLYDKQRELLVEKCDSCQGLGQRARYRRFQLIGYKECPDCGGSGEKEEKDEPA